MNRTAVVASIASSVVAGAFAAVPSPATAETFYPTGCVRYAEGGGWTVNCYLGDGYLDNANYILGAQRILSGLRCPPGQFDGLWGNQTRSAVKCFQGNTGRTQDGIVGPSTWDGFISNIPYQFDVDGYNVYQPNGTGDNSDKTFYRAIPEQRNGDNHWYLRPQSLRTGLDFFATKHVS